MFPRIKKLTAFLLYVLFIENTFETAVEISLPLNYGGINALGSYLVDDSAFYKVLNHGCWCAKLDPTTPFLSDLGGSNAADQLDEICKKWFSQRKCNDNISGGSCHSVNTTDKYYQLDITPSGSECITVGDDGYAFSECELDTCQIDLHYIKEIGQFIEDHPGFTASIVPADVTCSTNSRIQQASKACVVNLPPTPAPVQTTVPTPSICGDRKLDLSIVIDGSGSLGIADFDIAVDFIQDLVDTLTIGPDNIRVTIAQFSTNTRVYTTMDDTKTGVNAAIDLLRNDHMRKSTFTNIALDTIRKSIENHSRDVMQAVIVMTDGTSTSGLFYFDVATFQFYDAALKLKTVPDVAVYAIGVGSDTSITELESISSDPSSDYLYSISEFDQLEPMRLDITNAFCSNDVRSGRSTRPDKSGEPNLNKGKPYTIYGPEEFQ